ncbi:MAG: PilN domain-containing protein, partial [Gemmatimonadales bacterium]
MTARIGVAIGGRTLHATTLGSRNPREWHAALPAFGDPEWGERVKGAFREISGQCGGAEVHVAVLPPLCRVRALTLPPLSLEQSRRVIGRDAKRYFPGSGPWLTAVGRLERRSAAEPNLVAAAIPESLYRALLEAVGAAGWTLGGVVPAEAAWCAAIRPATRTRWALLVRLDSETCMLEVWGRDWRPHRRFRPGVDPDPGTLSVVREISADEAVRLAAEHADRMRGLTFVPEADRATARTRAGRVARRFWAAAAVLVLLAGAARYTDLRLELAAVRRDRAERVAQVEVALRTEQRITSLEETLAALDPAGGPAAWEELLTEVAMHLPQDAYLTGFAGDADSVALAGIAEDAGSVLETLRQAPSLRGVRLEAPIRQETRPGEAPVERFVVAAK